MEARAEAERRIKDRLARIEGQVRGIQKMIDEERDCEAILLQVLAARTALERAAGEIVGAYVDECMAQHSPDEARAKIARTVKLLTRAA
ncbi:MAG: metal-sensitive transcriptional regulator [Chloroflexi bacterium]|nr:metal-sensitive transcriptional regulator [Chloroflexota bacterium]